MAPAPKKRLGQHFLHDPGILGRIADALEAGPGDTVLEIGPGLGGLTGVLAARVGRLIAIEKDRDLVPGLRARFPRAEIIPGDALKLDWHALVGPGPFRVVGNIPYNITSPLLDLALRPPRPACIVFLVQKEVALRLAATPGSEDYGALTAGVQAVASVERLFNVSAGAFRPRPRVDSAVVRLRPLAAPLVADSAAPDFRRFVVGLFGFRRKQLLRGLRELTGLTAEQVSGALVRLEIEPSVRPETLDPATLVRLFDVVCPPSGPVPPLPSRGRGG